MAKAVKNGKIVRIEKMKAMLRAGKDRKQILQKLAKTCNVSSRTMDDELKEARESVQAEMAAIEEIRQAELSEQLKSEINASIKSDLELELILSQLAAGECKVEEWVKGVAVIRNIQPMEQISAIDKIFKLRGSNAPTKVANTDTKGNDIPLQPVKVEIIPPTLTGED